MSGVPASGDVPRWQLVAVREALRRRHELRALAAGGSHTIEAHGVAISITDLEQLVKGLSARKRQAVFLVIYEDRLQREAAGVMGVATATCAQYVAAGLQQIARSYFTADEVVDVAA